jgi:hypothetical protein
LNLALRVGNTRNDQGRAVHVDSGGFILLAGSFDGLLRFPGLSDALSMGGEDGFVALFAPEGRPRWARRIGSPGHDRALDVVTDGAGNVYVTGYFRDTVALPGTTLSAVGQTDLFLISYTRDGTFRWARQLGTPSYDLGTQVAVATGAPEVVYGVGAQGLSFLPGVTPPVLGPSAVVVTRFTPEGGALGSETWSSTGIAVPQGMAVMSGGRPVVSGAFSGRMTLGAAGMLSVESGTGLFVAGLTEAGAASWARRVSNTVAETELGDAFVAADEAGRFYVAGSLSGTDYLRGDATPRGGANRDLFFAQLDATGPTRSNLLFVAPGSQYLGGINHGREGHQLYYAGSFDPTADLGAPVLTSAGNLDILVGSHPAALDTPGWHRRYGGPGADEALDVVSVPGATLVTGYFSDTMVTEVGTLASMGGTDIFLLRFAE